MRIGSGVIAILAAGSIAVTSAWGLSSASADTVGPNVIPAGATTSLAASTIGQPLFLNLGPVPRGVRVGVQQTVFQFVHAGTPSGPVVAGMPVHFNVTSGPNAGQSGTVVTNDIGEAIFRFNTTGGSPSAAATDVVSSWLDLNDNNLFDANEPNNVNPFFTDPAATINGTIACDGRPATKVVSGSQHLGQGTGGPDVIAVFNSNSRVNLGDGDDVVCSWGANTSVYGDNGNDRVLLEGANNTVYANDGDDYISAINGNNLIYAGNGNDTVIVGDGLNTVWGGGGDDVLSAGTGPSKLSGDAGNDHLISIGKGGTYWGGSGSDTFDIAGKHSNS